MTTKIMAVLLTVISTVAFAGTNGTTGNDATVRVVAGTANGSYKLIYKGDEGHVHFKLVDQSGKVLHDERLKANDGFIRPINLSQLPSGDYTFVIENKSETLMEAVTYISTGDKLAGNIELEQVGRQIEVRGENLGTSTLNVYIYDDKGLLVHKNIVESNEVDQIYELSNVRSNWVNFVIASADEVVTDRRFSLK